jgi:hypothetical protein
VNETEKPLTCESPAPPTADQITEHLSASWRVEHFHERPHWAGFWNIQFAIRWNNAQIFLRSTKSVSRCFERGGDFDPRLDTILRVQARKLRK